MGGDISKLGGRATLPGNRPGQVAGGLNAATIYAGDGGLAHTIYAGDSGQFHTIYAGSNMNTAFGGINMETAFGGAPMNVGKAGAAGSEPEVVTQRITDPATRAPVTVVYNRRTGLYLDSKLGRWVKAPPWVAAQIG
ncbi:hypothetical protein [Meridianimarinicoccus roseus]|uniref:hypothetical protein n=1 Tax=Meridianimarinicoccus roseus TaxID=2072018 RepID=UPI0011B26912|nr:hypothetical protein [Meridianimarinicoccus roseus]